MKRGSYANSRRQRIVAAISRGVSTSREIAQKFGMPMPLTSSELHALADMGLIVRGPAASTERGRPCIRWRVVESAQ